MRHVFLTMIVGVMMGCADGAPEKVTKSSNRALGAGVLTLTGAIVTSDCQYESRTGYHIRFVDNYTSTSFTWETQYFIDSGCGELHVSEVIEGSYRLGGQVDDSLYALDYQIEGYSMTFLVEDKIASLNSQNYCDISDWSVGSRRDLQGTSCGFGADRLGMRYSSISVEGDEIHYSDSNDASSADRRNTKIDWNISYTLSY